MTKLEGAAPYVPGNPTMPLLREAVQLCHGCELYRHATHGVLGEGPRRAHFVLVGEQPGNEEDLQGRPFVGPAGRLLDRALAEAGIARDQVYVTNAVKHFKFEERGKRRIHKKPTLSEVRACHPWLEAEIAIIRPVVIVCLGATAAQWFLGSEFRLTKNRARAIAHPQHGIVAATVHPSSILRAPDSEQRELEYRKFVDDLKTIRKLKERSKALAGD